MHVARSFIKLGPSELGINFVISFEIFHRDCKQFDKSSSLAIGIAFIHSPAKSPEAKNGRIAATQSSRVKWQEAEEDNANNTLYKLHPEKNKKASPGNNGASSDAEIR